MAKKDKTLPEIEEDLNAKLIELQSQNRELQNKMTELELDKEIAEDLGTAKAELLQAMIENFDILGAEFRLVVDDLSEARETLKKEIENVRSIKEELMEILEEARQRALNN